MASRQAPIDVPPPHAPPLEGIPAVPVGEPHAEVQPPPQDAAEQPAVPAEPVRRSFCL